MAEEYIRRALHKHIAKIEEAYPLKGFNPLGAGGVADYFTVAHDTVELASAVKAAIDLKIPYVVLGQGQGVLFSDGGFPGLVIHNLAMAYGVALDKSQIVVDSGLPLSRFIEIATERGLGGLTDLYGQTGTIGGCIYGNVSAYNRPLISSVRYVTMLMPPTRLDREATINRYKREWLLHASGQTVLQHMKQGKDLADPNPVILTVLFQLTRVRQDELQNRLRERAKVQIPKDLMGPLFSTDGDIPLQDFLEGAEVAKLKVGNVYPDRYFPNYLDSRGGTVRSADIRELMETMQAKVGQRYGVVLTNCYEYLGVW